jgi:hypothetical protein
MKRIIICLFAVYFLVGLGTAASAADGEKSSSGKSVAQSVKGTAKEVKQETVKV